MKVLYPGSFDPLTLGHLDIIKRAAKIYESVEVLISVNLDKGGRLPVKDRIKLIDNAIQGSKLKNITVKSYEGLTVDYAKKHDFKIILRGIRVSSDFETELEMSQVNKFLSGVETVFLMTSPEYSFIRASRVWELLKLGGDISNLVPTNVASFLDSY